MTTLEIILISILWGITGIFIISKWGKANQHLLEWPQKVWIFLFVPLFLIGAIIRQVLIEDWK